MSASMVTTGSRVADIGCDHAHTGIWLIQNGIASKVIAMDVRKGPLEKAHENLMLFNLEGTIETRLSDGLEKLNEGEADTVIIAGMGGTLTVEILKKGLEKIAAARELILQPQSDIGMVRRFLRENGFSITQEKMCKEDGKFYNSMRAVHRENSNTNDKSLCNNLHPNLGNEGKLNIFGGRTGKTDNISYDNVYDEFGEILLKSQDPILKELLSILKYKNERNLASIEASENERGQKKKTELINQQNLIIEALNFYT